MKYTKLNRTAFAIALSMFWGGSYLITLWWAYSTGRSGLLDVFEVYPGFSPTPVGVFIGVLWGFFDGYISGFLFAAIYNYFTWLSETRRKDNEFIKTFQKENSDEE